MGKLLKTYLMPHPPIIIHDIGKGEETAVKSTINAVENVAGEIENLRPDTIVIVTPPHGPAFGDAISIDVDKKLKGDFKRFNASGIKLEYDGDLELTSTIIRKAVENKISIAPIDREAARRYRIPDTLDHGAMVPLYFIGKNYKKFKLVNITYGLLSNEELYHFGRIIRESIEEGSKNVVLVASGDLSHRLTPDAPAGFSPLGDRFDRILVEYLKKVDADDIMDMDRELIESAGECGYRSLLIMLGSLDGLDAEGKVLSYEGPFGVGYCVASFDINGVNEGNKRVELYYSKRMKKIESIRESEDEYVRLARQSLEHYIKTGRHMKPPDNLPDEMLNRSAGVFVSIKKDGNLRGCIGTIHGVQSNIAEEIIENAVSAGTGDPRFYPVEDDELYSLVYSVDVLENPEPIKSKDELDTKKYGVIVRKGGRSGLLLPNLEGVDTVDEQISIALKKAGIGQHEDYSMERFEVVRHR